MLLAITQARNARSAVDVPIAHRRPWRKRSRNGPMIGAMTANGAMVTSRYSATWPRASDVAAEKNSVSARAIVMRVSPIALTALSSMNRDRPDSPAPSAVVARLSRAAPLRVARDVELAAARAALEVEAAAARAARADAPATLRARLGSPPDPV